MNRKTIGVVFFSFVTMLLVGCHAPWNYENNSTQGPEHWGDNYPECRSGGLQSPIDIRQTDILDTEPLSVDIHFQPFQGDIVNNGYTIQAIVSEPKPIYSFVTMGQSSYSLLQFHFHAHAENRLNGKLYPMEAHFVMQNTQGQYVVLAVFIDRGKENRVIDKLWKNVDRVTTSLSTQEMVSLFPKNLAYYTFLGSLTMPACHQGITWIVFQHPITLSSAQLERFQQWYDNNYRPLQALNQRPIFSGQAWVF